MGLGIAEPQQLLQMPGNGLALPVRVRCQIHGFCLSRCILQLFDQILFALNGDIVGIEIFQIHTHGTLGQIPQVTHAGLDHIIRAQIFSNGLCLGGGLHNDQI